MGQFSAASLSLTAFEWRTALSLVLASQLAYEDKSTVEGTARNQWGLADPRFIESDDTQCLVASTADVVLVAFRGTESLGDWLGNLNAVGTTQDYGVVHRGFLGAFQVVDAELRSSLSALNGRKLLLTGHSLGGALATIAAAEWCGTFPVSWIYTYGQPAVGKGRFPAFIAQHYAGSFFRFVNNNDIVPRVPPSYSHVGRLFHFDADGGLQDDREAALRESAAGAVPGAAESPAEPPMLSEAEFDRLRADFLAQRARGRAIGLESLEAPMLEGIFPSVSDHYLDQYIRKIAARV